VERVIVLGKFAHFKAGLATPHHTQIHSVESKRKESVETTSENVQKLRYDALKTHINSKQSKHQDLREKEKKIPNAVRHLFLLPADAIKVRQVFIVHLPPSEKVPPQSSHLRKAASKEKPRLASSTSSPQTHPRSNCSC
jgi:hypothetical protein